MTRIVYDKDFPALMMGIAPDEGVVVAYIPYSVDGALYEEHPYRDGKRSFTVYSMDGVVLEMLPEDTKPVRWWQVREAARLLRLDYPEPILACAAEDFRVSCLPEVPAPADRVLAFRQYARGPWIKLTPEDLSKLENYARTAGNDAPTE